jgi:hypothetical protein
MNSEGLIYGLVYQCDADEINRVMADMCSSRFSAPVDGGYESNDVFQF